MEDISFNVPAFIKNTELENCAYTTFDDVTFADADAGSAIAFTEI
jgi:hypothetical protein